MIQGPGVSYDLTFCPVGGDVFGQSTVEWDQIPTDPSVSCYRDIFSGSVQERCCWRFLGFWACPISLLSHAICGEAILGVGGGFKLNL